MDDEDDRTPAHWQQLGESRCAELGWTPDTLPGIATRVLGASDYVFRTLRADTALAARVEDGEWLTAPTNADHYADLARTAVDECADEAALMRALRILRRREMVRIAWRDIGALADFDTIAAETSWLADAIIDAALAWLHAAVAKTRGEPTDADGNPQQLVVLALGKLGAGELNFSSDIDLIFVFPAAGETRGAARSISNDEFFIRLARRLIHVLDEMNADGFVYRVDMRLRPFGNAGPLVSSIDAVEDYYQTHGRDWERYALIRTRVVAGDRTAGAELLGLLRPFVYRRYLDFGALESIREMKALINAEVHRGGLQDNVKIGPGGIREVEFIAQAFQLIRGGRLPVLRQREVCPVLERLARLELLPAHAARDLRNAYRFLRTLEHRLQQVDDQQTHKVPEDRAGRARLAFALGLRDADALARELARHRSHVREHFDQIFGAVADHETPAAPDPLTVLLATNIEDADAISALTEAGFGEHAAEAWEPLAKLLVDIRLRHLSDRMAQRFSRLLPDLVRAAARTETPVTTLRRLAEVLIIIAQRGSYMSLLVERPLALSQLVRLCAGSALIARHIRTHPVVIDELLDSRSLYAPLRKAALAAEFAEQLTTVDTGDLEQEMDTLRREKQTNVLRVAAADLANMLPLMVVSDHLTEIAEVCVERAVALAWRDLVARHGVPTCEVEGVTREAGFAVIGYGKLGGIELAYSSDLDLVYLHGSTGEKQQTAGPRVVDNEVFFARLGQRIVHILSARTLAGTLYEVDLRLRPSGESGLMVSSLAGFASYQREEAWTWEHQALVRARVICGDPELAAGFDAVRRETLTRDRDGEALREEVRGMRARMRAELDQPDPALFDLKHGEGGIADIEFMVQYLVLRWALKLGDTLVFTDNIRLLEGIEAGGVIPATSTRLLADAYRAYRGRGHELALREEPGVVDATEFTGTRRDVSALWHELMEH